MPNNIKIAGYEKGQFDQNYIMRISSLKRTVEGINFNYNKNDIFLSDKFNQNIKPIMYNKKLVLSNMEVGKYELIKLMVKEDPEYYNDNFINDSVFIKEQKKQISFAEYIGKYIKNGTGESVYLYKYATQVEFNLDRVSDIEIGWSVIYEYNANDSVPIKPQYILRKVE